MIIYYIILPQFNPIVFSFGFVVLRWYSLMYLIGFLFSIWFAKRRINYLDGNWEEEEIEKLLYVGFITMFLGGRIGYILFYSLSSFLKDPLIIFKVWQGGMSFHGGLIGVIIAILWFSYKTQRGFFQISDFITPIIPFSLGCGRLGNFINGELYGKIAINIPWAVISPSSRYEDSFSKELNLEWKKIFERYGALPRHPSQIYELIFEGIILFIILNLFVKKKCPNGSITGLFLIFYGIFRIIVELFRQPDLQLGLFIGLSMGQILSIPMVFFGSFIVIKAYSKYPFKLSKK